MCGAKPRAHMLLTEHVTNELGEFYSAEIARPFGGVIRRIGAVEWRNTLRYSAKGAAGYARGSQS